MTPKAPPAVRWIVRTLEGAGFEAWAVGGAVRDVLLGRPSGDWDLATSARPGDIRRLFRRTVPLGIAHGTVGVLSRDGTLYEVTTFRRDVETDGRHAVVSFADTLDEDLSRRDFTINAIAWHPLREEMWDPHGGRKDLETGVLRTVGTPERRFAEDHLRVLRAFRFAGGLGLTIEDGTWGAACAAVPRLAGLSAERIREELTKILDAHGHPSRALDLYRRSGALAELYPEFLLRPGAADAEPDSDWAHTLEVLDVLPVGRPLLRLAALCRARSPRQTAQVLLRLRFSNQQVQRVSARAQAPSLPSAGAPAETFRRWLSAVGPRDAVAVARLDLAAAKAGRTSPHPGPGEVIASWCRARRVRASGPPLTVADLAVGGRDLQRMGLRPGPGFRLILDHLLDRVLANPDLNRPDTLEEVVRAFVASTGGPDGV